MKTKRLDVIAQRGVYVGIPAPIESANRLSNWQYDPKTQAWSNELGYEKYFSNRTNLGPFAAGAQREIDSLYCWSQHNGAKQSLLFETNGTLYEVNGSTEEIDTLLTGRYIPTQTDPPTSYNSYGRYLIISNGLDGPVKYRASRGGADRIYDLGWRGIPGTPVARTIGNPDSVPRTFLDAAANLINDQIWTPTDASFQGVTGAAADDLTRVSYKVSFVNEAGSESPLSGASNDITYKAVSVTRGGTSGVPRTGIIIDIPTGPNGTIARRIYRTKNDGSTYFFVAQVSENASLVYTDFRDDSQLGSEAPLPSESIVMPSPAAKFSASFKDCVFVDGGYMDAQRLYYSNPRQPDTFSADAYFEVGTRQGGDITGLAPYYNSLLIFRETAIDLIRGDTLNGFELVPFIQGIGTTSPSAIIPIPNRGISFISKDGIYLIAGGLDGGEKLTLNKISQGLEEFFDRANIDKLPQATGAYSSKDREVHYYFSADGKTFNSIGLVYHFDAKTWSQRDDFPVKCMTVDKDGNFIGGYDLNNVYSGAPGPFPDDAIAKGGLFVISGRRQNGYAFTGIGQNVKDAGPMVSHFRSSWLNFGDITMKKQVKYIYITLLTSGNVELRVHAYKDRQWTNGVDCGDMKLQRPEYKDQAVYDSDDYVWDVAEWQDKLLTRIRYPVANMSCGEFAFEFETNDQCEFIGYQIEYTVDGTKIIGGKR